MLRLIQHGVCYVLLFLSAFVHANSEWEQGDHEIYERRYSGGGVYEIILLAIPKFVGVHNNGLMIPFYIEPVPSYVLTQDEFSGEWVVQTVSDRDSY